MHVPFIRPLIPAAFVFLAALTVGCDSDPTGPTDPADLEFAPELGVDLAEMTLTESGLYLLDEVEGEGETAAAGDEVTVQYTGWLHDGRMFDTSANWGGSITVPLSQMIAGWAEGIPGMREGGRRLLVIPPHLAYGPDPILGQAWATLVFRVDLLEVVQ